MKSLKEKNREIKGKKQSTSGFEGVKKRDRKGINEKQGDKEKKNGKNVSENQERAREGEREREREMERGGVCESERSSLVP